MDRFPALAQTSYSVGGTAVHLAPALNQGVQGIVIIADSSNTADVFIGSGSVGISGAERGIPLAAGDRLSAKLEGPGASSWYGIASSSQTIIVQENG